MKFIENAKFYVHSVNYVMSKLEGWKPRKCKTEKDYEKSLYNFLHEKLSDVQITKQFATGRTHADIYIDNKIIIELKHNLNTTAKYHRLIGQLADYKEWGESIIIILTGETDMNLRKQLDGYLKKEGLSVYPLVCRKVTIYDK